VVNFYVQQNVPPNERQVIIEKSARPEWKTIDIPFVALNDMDIGEAPVGINTTLVRRYKLPVTVCPKTAIKRKTPTGIG